MVQYPLSKISLLGRLGLCAGLALFRRFLSIVIKYKMESNKIRRLQLNKSIWGSLCITKVQVRYSRVILCCLCDIFLRFQASDARYCLLSATNLAISNVATMDCWSQPSEDIHLRLFRPVRFVLWCADETRAWKFITIHTPYFASVSLAKQPMRLGFLPKLGLDVVVKRLSNNRWTNTAPISGYPCLFPPPCAFSPALVFGRRRRPL